MKETEKLEIDDRASMKSFYKHVLISVSIEEKLFRIDVDKEPKRTQPFLVTTESSKKSFTKQIPKSDRRPILREFLPYMFLVLSRLDDFLPKLKKSNEELLNVEASERDIENVPEGSKYIKMKLGLGLFDMKNSEEERDTGPRIILPGEPVQKPGIETFLADTTSSSEEDSDDSSSLESGIDL